MQCKQTRSLKKGFKATSKSINAVTPSNTVKDSYYFLDLTAGCVKIKNLFRKNVRF